MSANWRKDGPQEEKPVRVLYVSGPMSGYPESNYPAFNDAAELLRKFGYTVINPAELNPAGMGYAELLSADIRDVLECDGVAVLEGWWTSVGARLETNLAGTLGKPVRPVQEWLHRATPLLAD